jgi:hypothetical protein
MSDRKRLAESFRELLLFCFSERQTRENEIADAFRIFVAEEYHRDLGFDTLDDFLTAAPPQGLGIDADTLEPLPETRYHTTADDNDIDIDVDDDEERTSSPARFVSRSVDDRYDSEGNPR